MKQFLYAVLAMAAVDAASSTGALAHDPSPSAENYWPGNAQTVDSAPQVYAVPPAAQPITTAPTQYRLYGHYVGGGKWREEWVPLQ